MSLVINSTNIDRGTSHLFVPSRIDSDISLLLRLERLGAAFERLFDQVVADVRLKCDVSTPVLKRLEFVCADPDFDFMHPPSSASDSPIARLLNWASEDPELMPQYSHFEVEVESATKDDLVNSIYDVLASQNRDRLLYNLEELSKTVDSLILPASQARDQARLKTEIVLRLLKCGENTLREKTIDSLEKSDCANRAIADWLIERTRCPECIIGEFNLGRSFYPSPELRKFTFRLAVPYKLAEQGLLVEDQQLATLSPFSPLRLAYRSFEDELKGLFRFNLDDHSIHPWGDVVHQLMNVTEAFSQKFVLDCLNIAENSGYNFRDSFSLGANLLGSLLEENNAPFPRVVRFLLDKGVDPRVGEPSALRCIKENVAFIRRKLRTTDDPDYREKLLVGQKQYLEVREMVAGVRY